MNASVSQSRRRFAATFGALGLTSALAMSGLVGEGVAATEAQWTDTEVTKAEVRAAWMQGFTRVTDPGWKMRNVRDGNLPTFIGPSGPVTDTHDYGLTMPKMGTYAKASGVDDHRSSFGDGRDTTIVPTRTVLNNLWMGRYTTESGGTDDARAGHCMSFPDPTSINASTSNCFAIPGRNTRLSAHQNTIGYTFSILGSAATSKIARVNVSGFASTAQCFTDGTSSATISHDSNSVLQLARETTTLNYSFDRVANIKDLIPQSESNTVRHDGSSNLWGRLNVEGSGDGDASYVLTANVRKDTYTAPFYAIAEMDLVIQIYSAGGTRSEPGVFIDQINLPLTRSECGFSDGTQPMPEMAGTWRGDANQLAWPERSLGNVAPLAAPRYSTFTFPAESASFSGLLTMMDSELALEQNIDLKPIAEALEESTTANSTSATSLATTTLSPATSVASPTEHATTSETMPSEPLNPSLTSESPTTSSSQATIGASTTGTPTRVPATSAEETAVPTSQTPSAITETSTQTSTTEAPSTTTPPIIVPDEPGSLTATAQVEVVDKITVGDEELDVVVVKGDAIPTDARAGAAALETRLAGGNPGTTWTTFVSDDPATDGWRWAAISQKTGTVVYIR